VERGELELIKIGGRSIITARSALALIDRSSGQEAQ
jgi:hypothetical protein